jgi:uncharacterized protein YjbJ (UPF0337 family)
MPVKVISEARVAVNSTLVSILKFNQESIMSLEDRAKATAKNIEGKVQEAVGNLTGDPKDQLEGKEKQAEAKVRHIIENVKDEVKKDID